MISRGLEPMHRCFNARNFRLEVWFKGVKLDSRVIQLPWLKINIVGVQIREQKLNKLWHAEIKNPTPYPIKIAVQPLTLKGEAVGVPVKQAVQANGYAEFNGVFTSNELQRPIEFRALYDNPNICGNQKQAVLDKWIAVRGDILIEHLSFDNFQKQFNLRIGNNGNVPASLSITSMLMQRGNAIAGTTSSLNIDIQPGRTYQTTSAYGNAAIIPGMQLKVQVRLRNTGEIIDEKTIDL
jgi:hypothetical protein